jgi:hypothetical protein
MERLSDDQTSLEIAMCQSLVSKTIPFLYSRALLFFLGWRVTMKQTRNPGRPLEWVLNEEIVETYELSTELKTQNPGTRWSDMRDLLKIRLEQIDRKDLLSKLDKIWGLMKHVIPLPPRCICGRRVYSYTYNNVENENEHYWEIFARCTNPNCRYMRRYLPSTSYKWSRPKSIIRELEKMPTFYEMDGQKVEDAR